MYWAKDPRYRNGGYWRCAEKQRSKERERYALNPDSRRARRIERWHNQSNAKWREANHRRQMNHIRQRIRERRDRKELL